MQKPVSKDDVVVKTELRLFADWVRKGIGLDKTDIVHDFLLSSPRRSPRRGRRRLVLSK